MPRYKLTIEYDGVNFSGFQRQKSEHTVQQLIEDSIFKLTKEKVTLTAAGRTDAGVHAKGQIAHFDILNDVDLYKFQRGLNHFLMQKGASIKNIEEVDVFFHARFSAQKRYYQYVILNRFAPSPLLKNRVWHIPHKLNIEEMKKACSFFLGQHDFSAFRYAKCQSHSAIRTMDLCELIQEDNLIKINIGSKSFLHNQIRIMLGTLVKIGEGKHNASYIQTLLEQKDRTKSGATAPPYGLYFMKVDY